MTDFVHSQELQIAVINGPEGSTVIKQLDGSFATAEVEDKQAELDAALEDANNALKAADDEKAAQELEQFHKDAQEQMEKDAELAPAEIPESSGEESFTHLSDEEREAKLAEMTPENPDDAGGEGSDEVEVETPPVELEKSTRRR